MDQVRPTPRASSIPRAARLPLVGSLPGLVRGQLEFLEQCFADRGRIFELDLGVSRAVIVADVGAAERILIGNVGNYDKQGDFWDGVRDVFGQGLAMSEGALWRRQRKLMQPKFHRSQVEGYRGVISETIEQALGGLESDAPVDVAEWSDHLLAALTVRLLFGSSHDRGRTDEIREVMAQMFDQILTGMVTRKIPRWLPTPGRKRFEASRSRLDTLILQVIDERRRSREFGDDLLGVLLGATDESGSMSDRQLRDEAVTFYVAGYETTGTVLAWTLWLLGSHPEIRAEVQAELDQPEAPLLRACVQEGLRLFPAVPLIPRRAVQDDVIGGLEVPAGTTVAVSPWLIHRDPQQWPRPREFDPSRFLDTSVRRPRLALIPFGAGQRTCVGKVLAQLELELALRLVLARFDPVVNPNLPPPKPRLSTTLRARAGIVLEMRPRGLKPSSGV